MDNGLIFPYPRRSAHTEPSNAKRLKLGGSSDLLGGARDPNW
jgi:hypothetical protein